jgi:hypothetical protein
MLDDVIRALLEEFPEEWSLPHRILKQFENGRTSVPTNDLVHLAWKSIDLPANRRGVPEDYQSVVRHAVLLIRNSAFSLFLNGRNPEGWSLLYHHTSIGWQSEHGQMEWAARLERAAKL